MPYQSIFRPDLFKGQTIIVTGGGSGIGRCTAHELVALGANVAILGRTPEKLAEVKAEIEEDGGQVLTQVCDIRDEAMVIAAIDAVLGAYGRIDGLVNNAGGQYRAPMKSISTKGFEAVVRSNLTGGFIFMREVYNRQHYRRHLARLARVRAFRCSARRHVDADRNRGVRMVSFRRARQCSRAGWHRVQRVRYLHAGNAEEAA
jgi:NAD(P)-dependent dehydrogenase (short-subunit alcohol dehydrogenase family)